ncbi:MAG: HDIG domain-containing metalloprotein [Opitutaceae bacterium]
MPLFQKLITLLRRSESTPSNRSATVGFLEASRMVTALIFLLTVASIVLICYEGVGTSRLPVLSGQIATVSVHASVPFSYASKEQTRMLKENLKDRVPPVFRLEFTPYNQFESHFRELLARLDDHEREFPPNTPSLASRRQALTALVEEFNAKGPYRASVDDVDILLHSGDSETRKTLIERSLVVLHEIYNEGTHDATLSSSNTPIGSVTIFQILKPDGEVVQRPVQSMEDALIFLRVNLMAEGMPRELVLSLFRLMRNGLVPNLVFDQEASTLRESDAIKTVRPVVVHVERGQAIIEQGTRVTPEQYEMLVAHREYLHDRGETAMDQGLQLLSRTLMVLAMVAACAMYIHLEDPDTLRSNGRLTLLALVVIANLAMVRLTYAFLDTDFFIHDDTWAATLPFLAPTALAPLIVAILIDVGSGIFVALFISLFAGVIYGNRFDVQVITFLASIVAVHGCRFVRSRGSVVRAGAASGVVVFVTTLVLGLAGQTPIGALIKQMSAGLLMGILTGIIVVGLLPILESLFRRTTDITLLELTDYNHPLLRLMQMEAPGTYHHSLVVANLAENAAAAIGANPLLARVCALYHDIGKTKNPGFFSENQNENLNPHDHTSPEESARIIKKHVSDGIELARKHGLPRAILDSIQQHHGTTLVRFFYLRARQQSKTKGADAPALQNLNEESFRYDGPKPRFKESAIIALADSVEAASRSLKDSSAEELEKLIDSIVRERLAEGQLDDAPITLAEVAKARESFNFTLQNMLHSRVAYPKG